MPREVYYLHPVTNQHAYFPWGVALARKKRVPRYQSETPCDECGAATPVRFTRSHVCQNCSLADVPRLQRWVEGGMVGEFYPTALVLYPCGDEPVLRHVHRPPCIHGPHLSVPDPATGDCLNCEREKAEAKAPPRSNGKPRSDDVEMALAAPDMILSRQDARLLGLKVFRTGKACQEGHRGWRYVSTGGCLSCKLGL